MSQAPRVAFFTDSFHETNGVALTSRQLESFARRRQLPFLSVRAGPETRWTAGTLELARGAAAFPVERDMSFDLLFLRHRTLAADIVRRFRAEVVHITGPSDVGILGAWVAHRLHLPLVASWHTNLHEFGAKRLEKVFAWLPPDPRQDLASFTERGILESCARFYRLARVLMAPNPELVQLLARRTGRDVFLMRRGVDTDLFTPARRTRTGGEFVLGYCGRITAEKSVRFLKDIENRIPSVRFLIIGDGGERRWLEQNLKNAEFPGILKGEALAAAYADMDLFVFPSRTDTYGNVVQEALASGVPCIVTAAGGPKFLVKDGETGFIARDKAEFLEDVVRVVANRELHARLSEAARKQALTLSWDRVFEEVYDVYRYALTPPPLFRTAS